MIALALVPVAAIAEGQYEPADGIDRASGFQSFVVHFGGDPVSGMPLTTVLGGRDKRRTSWSFIYGTCDPPAGEGGCRPPLEIQTASTCFRYRDIYPGKQSSYRFRGAAASRNAGADLEIYTGRVTISIFGMKRLIEDAARAVRPISAIEAARLAPPARGSLRGRLRCQEPPNDPPFPFGQFPAGALAH